MLKGKTAVVTGASRGIGREIALSMARAGANIAVVCAKSLDAADSVCQAARALGVKAEPYLCDVASFEDTAALTKRILDDFGSVDILVNNAGITKDGLILRMTDEDFDRVVDVNLKGAFNMTRHLCAHFVRRRFGRIINITSVSGLCGNAGQANYSAAKAGLIGLTKATARELSGRGVTCNAIAPGFIDTDMTAALPDDMRREAGKAIPMKRMGTASEVAPLAVFLAGDGASYITGEVIRVDGGMCM